MLDVKKQMFSGEPILVTTLMLLQKVPLHSLKELMYPRDFLRDFLNEMLIYSGLIPDLSELCIAHGRIVWRIAYSVNKM